MTREEAIKTIENAKHFAYDGVYGEAFDVAIQALEQGPVLDKIRAELERIDLLAEYTRGDIKRMALDIIDKYKAESEE